MWLAINIISTSVFCHLLRRLVFAVIKNHPHFSSTWQKEKLLPSSLYLDCALACLDYIQLDLAAGYKIRSGLLYSRTQGKEY